MGSLCDREVASSASDRQGLNFESCVWRAVSSHSSHHPQEFLLAQFSLNVHKGDLKPHSFHLIYQCRAILLLSSRSELVCRHSWNRISYGFMPLLCIYRLNRLDNCLSMVRWITQHCPPDTEFEIWAMEDLMSQTLPLWHEGFPQYWTSTNGRERHVFISLKLKFHSGRTKPWAPVWQTSSVNNCTYKRVRFSKSQVTIYRNLYENTVRIDWGL